MKSWHKTILISLGAVVLSTVAIQANDIANGISGNLLGTAIESQTPCGVGAVLLNTSQGALCVDTYEASPSAECPIAVPDSTVDTQTNLNELDCQPQSKEATQPWRFVSLVQAQQLCARSGKRLPTNDEWYSAALGQTDQSQCALDESGPKPTGASQCVTKAGVSDMVGNVWEWINAEVTEGEYNGRAIPESGYVAMVDTAGIVVTTNSAPDVTYGDDYAKTNQSGVYGVIRGGFYDSRSDGGVYAQNLSVPLNLQTGGVGFRCVKSI